MIISNKCCLSTANVLVKLIQNKRQLQINQLIYCTRNCNADCLFKNNRLELKNRFKFSSLNAFKHLSYITSA